MEDQLRSLVALGPDPDPRDAPRSKPSDSAPPSTTNRIDGRPPSILRRLAWYGVALIVVVAIVSVHPTPGADLRLPAATAACVVFGFAVRRGRGRHAVAMAWLRYGACACRTSSQYPGALAQRDRHGIHRRGRVPRGLLGFLIVGGVDPTLAIMLQAAIYALATRLGAPGRDRYDVRAGARRSAWSAAGRR